MIFFSIFIILLFSILFLFFIPSTEFYIRRIGLLVSSLVFILSIFLLDSFSLNTSYFQSITTFNFGFELLNFYFFLGLDGVSILFFVLSSFLIFLCVLFVWDEKFLKEYTLALLSLDLLLLLVFSTLDILFFYIFFEAILIPMYIMIGVWGSRERKIRASYLFFFYTLVGSLCMLLALLYIYGQVGTLNYEYVYWHSFSFKEQCWLWLGFFMSLATKIPLFPFHIWLPEAHVEAPTAGSVLLAGILLKLGVYGFLRFNLTLFPEASFFFAPIVYVLSLLGIVLASLTALRQTDLKRIVAYSSVAHMNLITMGIFSFNVIGIEGSIVQSISHGFVSGAMFFLIGFLYKRYHSRLLFYYSGLTQTMPLYSFFFLFFTMSNIALPGTSSFVGEFLLLLGIFQTNTLAALFATLGVILSASYSLWLYNRLCFGNITIGTTVYYSDISFKEFFILFILLIFVLFLGIYPFLFLKYVHFSCANFILISLV